MKTILPIALAAVLWLLSYAAYSNLMPGVPDSGILPIVAVPLAFLLYGSINLWSDFDMLIRLGLVLLVISPATVRGIRTGYDPSRRRLVCHYHVRRMASLRLAASFPELFRLWLQFRLRNGHACCVTQHRRRFWTTLSIRQ